MGGFAFCFEFVMDHIVVRGARTHNLKNINISIPRNKLVVITGLSGSGKSSLAFDTLYAEGQRRYVESLSTYARQFLSIMEKPDIDHIEGLSPAISIEQKSTSHNPRSTVGTITEIYDYLRLMFARVGEPHCPDHNIKLEAQTVSQMVDKAMSLPADTRIMVLAPIIRARKGEHLHVFSELRGGGFIRARVDGLVCELDYPPDLVKNKKHSIDVVIDRLKIKPGLEQRLAESFETALQLADGLAVVSVVQERKKSKDIVFSSLFACPTCGHSISELEPRLFSFNNPAGACSGCDGLGVKQFFDEQRIIVDESLALSEGAIRGWDRRNIYYFQMLTSLAAHYGFKVEMPFNKLPRKYQNLVLRGSGKEVIDFHYVNDRGDTVTRSYPFEGILPNMERRYKDSESSLIREELSRYINTQFCKTCDGSRLRESARHVFVGDHAIHQITALTVEQSLELFQLLKLPGRHGDIAARIIREILERLRFLFNVGLEYLTLDRTAETLSGGEAQRIRLASQIGSGLVGVTYILDEPSIGLHQRDNARLLETLYRLRDLGNTIIVVEHDEEAIRSADHVVDLGPGAGIHGGEIVVQGKPDEIIASTASLTGRYLSGDLQIEIPEKRVKTDPQKTLVINGAQGNNLQAIDVEIPVGLFTCVTGVSGSGKSTLINNTLYPALASKLHHGRHQAAPHRSIKGLENFDKVIDIDQSPIGRTPRSNPATYTGLFTPIRELYAAVPESRARGYKPGRFSFNVRGGRCEACQGDGLIKVEMHFLPDIYVSCDLCKGGRYNRETLDIRYKGKTISEVLAMTVAEACDFFSAVPIIKRKLDTLMDVGLSYLSLGQSATTLSGGEAQRIKLARELSKRDTGRTLYILDEPTTGLHFHDIRQLLQVLHRLRDGGNTVIVIEHNLDVVKTADWIIDLGPEGGHRGGQLVACGTPETVAGVKESYTGCFLAKILQPAASKKKLIA